MSLSETYISRKQLIADNLNTMGESTADVTDGLTTLAGKILDIPNKQSTTLTISVPLNLEYGDDFNITGTLTSAGDGVSNATVKLKVGNTVVDSDTTDGTGEVSFTQCPVRTGNHSFQLVFEGDINHASSESTVVTRDVEKETSVITLDYPLAGSNHYSDEDIVVSGVLTDNDNTPLANKDILIMDGDAAAFLIPTESDGSFSDTITFNAGSQTLNVIYEGDENYTSSSVSRNLTIVNPTLTLSGTKNILSYADRSSGNEKCSFTAQFNAANCSGKTVSFDIVDGQGNVIANIGTGVTNSAGLAVCDNDYVTQGVGNVKVQAFCGSFVTESFVVYDYQYYADNMQKIKNSFIADTTTASDRTIYLSSFTFNSDVEVEFKLKNIPNNWLLGFGSNGTSVNQKGVWFKIQNYNQNKASIMWQNTSGGATDAGITTSYDTSTVFTIKSENIHKIYWYLDSVVKASRDTSTSIPLGLRLDVFNNMDYEIEYIKVKPL